MFKSISSVLLLTLLATSIVGSSSFADEKKEEMKEYQSETFSASRIHSAHFKGAYDAFAKAQEIVSQLGFGYASNQRASLAVAYHRANRQWKYNGSEKQQDNGVYLRVIAPVGCSQTVLIATESSMSDMGKNETPEQHLEARKQLAKVIKDERVPIFQAAAELINSLSVTGDFESNIRVMVKAQATSGGSDTAYDATLRVTITTTNPDHVCKNEADEKIESGKKDNKQSDAPADSQKQNSDANKQELGSVRDSAMGSAKSAR